MTFVFIIKLYGLGFKRNAFIYVYGQESVYK